MALLGAWIAYKLRQTADVQYISTLVTAFQDEWHSRAATLMRAAVQTDSMKSTFNVAVERAYGKKIEYTRISDLLQPEQLQGNRPASDRLAAFHNHLASIVFRDPTQNGKVLFSAYEALYRVLLSFDRLAVLCDEPLAMSKFIRKYRPPLRDFSNILQAFVAVRMLLREPKDKNYKKDYMQLLNMLGLADYILYKKCKAGLKKRKEWTIIDTWKARTRLRYRRRNDDC